MQASCASICRRELAGATDQGAASVAAIPDKILSATKMKRQERENIAAALRRTKGKIYGDDGAAKLLGMKPTTLLSRLARLGLKPTRQVPASDVPGRFA